MKRYKLLGVSDKEHISDRFQTCVQDWLNKWVGNDSPGFIVSTDNIFAFLSGDDSRIYGFSFNDSVIYLVFDEDQVHGIADLILRLSDVDKKLYDLNVNAYIELLSLKSIADLLSSVVGVTCAQFEVCGADKLFGEFYKGAGYSQTYIKIGELSLRFIFPASIVLEQYSVVADNNIDLTPFDPSLLVNHKVLLEANMLCENIKLLDLIGVSVGDVLVLDHKVDQPLELCVNGQAIMPVELGARNNQRCIKFNG